MSLPNLYTDAIDYYSRRGGHDDASVITDVPDTRHRNLSEKGLSFARDSKQKLMRQLFKKLSSKTDVVNTLMKDNRSPDDVRKHYTKWMVLYEEFLKAYQELCSLFPLDEQDQYVAIIYGQKKADMLTFKTSVDNWIEQITKRDNPGPSNTHTVDFIESKDSVSQISRRASRASRHTRASSLASSLSAARLVEEQKRAELSARSAKLEQMQELEMAKLKITMRQERLKLDTEMAVTDAKRQVIDDMDLVSTPKHIIPAVNDTHTLLKSPVSSVSHDIGNNDGEMFCQNESMYNKSRHMLNPHATPFEQNNCSTLDYVKGGAKPKCSQLTYSVVDENVCHGDVLPQQNKDAFIPGVNVSDKQVKSDINVSDKQVKSDDILLSVVKHLKKPVIDVKSFSCDPLEYRKFMRQFQAKVVVHCDSDDEKMSYLEQYTSGEAGRIVSGYSYLPAEVGYRSALQELEDRYGNNEVIADAFIRRALNWPIIKADDSKGLDEFSIFLTECGNAVKGIEAVRVLQYSENMKQLVAKLPFHCHDKWRAQIQQLKLKGEIVSFHHLVKFVKVEAVKANDPIYGKNALKGKDCPTSQRTQNVQRNRAVQKSRGSYSTNVTDMKEMSTGADTKPEPVRSISSNRLAVDSAITKPCLYCTGPGHRMDECRKFGGLLHKDRILFLKQKGICYGCLKVGHMKQSCTNKLNCDKCKGVHPTILHSNDFPSRDSPKSDNNGETGISACAELYGRDVMEAGECTMAIIPVKVKMRNGLTSLDTYAFLDPGSSVSFCSESLMTRLGCSGKKMKITIDTMGAPHTMDTYLVDGLQVSDLNQRNVIQLPKVYSKNKMPVSSNHIPKESDISQWKHLSDVKLPEIKASVDILIGNNVPDAYTPLQVRTGPRGSPHASKTLLGWVVWNVIRPVHCNRSSQVFPVNRTEITAITEVEDLQQLDRLVRGAINMDFPERVSDDKKECSRNDRKFLEKVNKSIRMIDNHYEIALPFRDENVVLPNNETQARNRLLYLERKLRKLPQFYEDYKAFMSKIIQDGHAEEVPPHELDRKDGKVWFIPHHGIYHPKKPDKIRVVFDCTAKFNGISLNSVLLQGPDVTSNLLGVLMRFREENVAIMGDVEAMFHQVRVPKHHADCLRFLWWPNGDLSREPVVYRMLVHLFGAVSSPSCANTALRQTALDNEQCYDEAITKLIWHHFYVDDCLVSTDCEEKAITLVQEVSKLCADGGFHITKWITNRHAVLASIPINDRAKDVKHLNLEHQELPNERALGVHWEVESDTFGFNISPRDFKATRRSILSIVSSVYDPLGFAAPYILTAKIILQELCLKQVGWDDEIDDHHLEGWKQWLVNLPRLGNVHLDRCYKPNDFGLVVSKKLHIFCDASNHGYGMVAYLRLVNDRDQIHCSFVIGKSRVAPLKKVTVPRMELTAAVVAVRIARIITKELNANIGDVCMWTDSTAVLKYISNEATRFRTFVANRVEEIRDSTEVAQWKYVETKSNPADAASRGQTMDKFIDNKSWFRGPQFLWSTENDWPQPPDTCKVLSDDDPETKKQVHVVADIGACDSMSQFLKHYSDWNKLKRATAWILVAIDNLRKRIEDRKNLDSTDSRKETRRSSLIKDCEQLKSQHLTADHLEKAEESLIRYTQQQNFSKEMEALEKPGASKSLLSGSLRKLDPFLDNGILRVGGRLRRSSIPYNAKYPILLPRDSTLGNLLIREYHKKVGHQGRSAMLGALRQRYWILGANTAIKKFLSRCVLCRKYRAHGGEQKMADLPPERLQSGESPFTRVGMDLFGPIDVKRGRSVVKRYGVIFTCLSIRAVHLEVAYSMDTDSCINAIRRFISRRGPVKYIRSDNGSNLVASERELREEIERWNLSKFHDLSQQGIIWEFNPPSGSHFGGVWERMIRTVRKVLHGLLREQVLHLDDESLQTVFCEVEAIVNSRPLTELTDDPNDPQALTPNHLLHQSAGESLPPGIFQKTDNYVQRRWRQVQYLADIFWKRWSREYLPLLQSRQKWNRVKRNVEVDDLVLLMDNSPRNAWSLGRVVESIKDKLGLVRMVKIQTKSNVLLRPIDKICVILEADIA